MAECQECRAVPHHEGHQKRAWPPPRPDTAPTGAKGSWERVGHEATGRSAVGRDRSSVDPAAASFCGTCGHIGACMRCVRAGRCARDSSDPAWVGTPLHRHCVCPHLEPLRASNMPSAMRTEVALARREDGTVDPSIGLLHTRCLISYPLHMVPKSAFGGDLPGG